MLRQYLEYTVYPEEPFEGQFDVLPGFGIVDIISNAEKVPGANVQALENKLLQSCRKLCLMWYASKEALKAEQEFYSTTIKDAPALFGEDAIKIHYHLEASVLFARSALDIAANLFGWTLPDPFPRKRYDSFNDLVKTIMNGDKRLSIALYLEVERRDKYSWLSFVAGRERGRSLRDKIAHQTEFPIDYMELNPPSEKESAIVRLGDELFEFLTLKQFIEELRGGVINSYLSLEDLSQQFLSRQA
jgi:hypothetical protein